MAICTIGGFISPLIIETQVVAPWLPFGLYGLAAFLGFLSSFCIPGSDFYQFLPQDVAIRPQGVVKSVKKHQIKMFSTQWVTGENFIMKLLKNIKLDFQNYLE